MVFMQVPRVGNNPGYGQGPQAEKANKDAPRKQHHQQQQQQPKQGEEDSVEIHPPAQGEAVDPKNTAPNPKVPPKPKPGQSPPLDISG